MRLPVLHHLLRLLGFNPRICKRCDYICANKFINQIGFNPRICKRCDLWIIFLPILYFCFNPRICKRCDALRKISIAFISVSIHASVKDATCLFRVKYINLKVSIHASVKDATFPFVYRSFLYFCFNPRICKRCDYCAITEEQD